MFFLIVFWILWHAYSVPVEPQAVEGGVPVGSILALVSAGTSFGVCFSDLGEPASLWAYSKIKRSLRHSLIYIYIYIKTQYVHSVPFGSMVRIPEF